MKLAPSFLIFGVSAREKVDLRADLGDFNEVVGEALITPNVAETFEEITGIPPNARMVKEGFMLFYFICLFLFYFFYFFNPLKAN